MSLARKLSQALAKRTPVNPVRSKLTRALATLTFDDVPKSATEAGAAALEAAGVHGTFYVCGAHTGHDFEGMTQHERADLERLRDAGHEIGCHTFAHQDATRAGLEARLADHNANRRFAAEALPGERLASFAYPYGSTSIRAKAFYSRRFLTCRGVFGGLNRGLVDFAELRANALEHHAFDLGRLKDQIAEARESAGWLVFFTHDVSPEPSRFGCRQGELEATIGALREAGIDILPVKAAASRVLFGHA